MGQTDHDLGSDGEAVRAERRKMPEPKLTTLDFGTRGYMRILGGPPETLSMRSGLVVLEPGSSVGQHNTDSHEEVLVVLEGAGEMRITGRSALLLKGGCVAYCPPRTEHDVICTGATSLKYVYVLASTA